jgi:hypothetical protein
MGRYGTRPHHDIPVGAFYLDGRLQLDEMVSQVYDLADATRPEDMHAGKLNRGRATLRRLLCRRHCHAVLAHTKQGLAVRGEAVSGVGGPIAVGRGHLLGAGPATGPSPDRRRGAPRSERSPPGRRRDQPAVVLGGVGGDHHPLAAGRRRGRTGRRRLPSTRTRSPPKPLSRRGARDPVPSGGGARPGVVDPGTPAAGRRAALDVPGRRSSSATAEGGVVGAEPPVEHPVVAHDVDNDLPPPSWVRAAARVEAHSNHRTSAPDPPSGMRPSRAGRPSFHR